MRLLSLSEVSIQPRTSSPKFAEASKRCPPPVINLALHTDATFEASGHQRRCNHGEHALVTGEHEAGDIGHPIHVGAVEVVPVDGRVHDGAAVEPAEALRP